MSLLPSIKKIIDVVPTAMAVVDENMCYLVASEKWIEFFRLDGDNVIGHSHNHLFPNLSEHWLEINNQALQGIDGKSEADQFVFEDGSVYWIKWESSHWRHDDGTIGGIILYMEDVTQKVNISQNEERFQLFMDYLPGLCWITNNHNKLIYANKCYFEKLHLSHDVIGKQNQEIFGAAIADQAHSSDIEVLHSGENKFYYQTLRDNEGHLQYFKTYKFPIINPETKETLIGAISFDITKTKQLEEELYQSEEQFKQAFEHSMLGMAIISRYGILERVNKSFAEMLGYQVYELCAKNIQDITFGDDLDSSEDYIFQLREGILENVKTEKRYIHKDGTIIWAVVAATMLKDRMGKPLHFVSQIEDITKRREIEDNLTLSEKKYRTIFENVQDVFYQTNNAGIVTDISPSIETHSGYKRDEVINQPVNSFYYYPQDRERIVKTLQEKGAVIDFEVRLKTKMNEIRYASVNSRLLMENGEVIGADGSMRDVTTRKFHEIALLALNTELTASNDQKNKLLSIIGHDLRNPISGSLQLLELILMDFKTTSSEELQAYLTQMRLELSNSFNLLEDLLTWAKAQFNSLSFLPVEISDIEKQVEKSLSTIKPLANKKDIKIGCQIIGDPTLNADLSMLDTILRNLITNAIKFTPSGGRINIKVSEHEFDILFAVEDNGIGISPDTVAKLFNADLMISTYGTSGEKGTGLGLSICREFVLKHQGRIWVESELGVGSTFCFTIPKYQQAAVD